MELNNADSIGAIDTDAALRVILLSGIIRWSLENVATIIFKFDERDVHLQRNRRDIASRDEL